jgi:PPOX class probable F420-dependent enzyme
LTSIPQQYLDLLADETKAFAFLATVMHDGTPQVTPLWFNAKGANIWINSSVGHVKDKNIRRNPYVALSIPDPKNPYRCLQIRGKVVEFREAGARDHINELSCKYTGNPYSENPEQIRVIYIIEPTSVSGKG